MAYFILGIVMFGGGIGGVWLVVCWGGWGISSCVLQWWKLACSRRSLMVSVGVGRLLHLVCADELRAMFWQYRVILMAPDPHGGRFRVIMGLGHSCMCGCSLLHEVFVSM